MLGPGQLGIHPHPELEQRGARPFTTTLPELGRRVGYHCRSVLLPAPLRLMILNASPFSTEGHVVSATTSSTVRVCRLGWSGESGFLSMHGLEPDGRALDQDAGRP